MKFAAEFLVISVESIETKTERIVVGSKEEAWNKIREVYPEKRFRLTLTFFYRVDNWT